MELQKEHNQNQSVPVIAIDGPSSSGKGTISVMLAKYLKWHFLDSGSIYRAIAWAILHYQISPDDQAALARLLKRVQIAIQDRAEQISRITCDGHDISDDIRSEDCAMMASKVSAYPMVREAVLQYQRDFRRPPGLVADGRDMGTVVFPDANVKFFFEADPKERAERRFKQLQARGINVSLRDIQEELMERDRRDVDREISPTKPADDAIVIDTTNLGIDQVFAEVVKHVEERLRG